MKVVREQAAERMFGPKREEVSESRGKLFVKAFIICVLH